MHPRGDRTVLYFHGGGYASGSAEACRAFVGHLARHFEAEVVVPDYRLAPQHPFPAPIEDAFAVYRALLQGVPIRAGSQSRATLREAR